MITHVYMLRVKCCTLPELVVTYCTRDNTAVRYNRSCLCVALYMRSKCCIVIGHSGVCALWLVSVVHMDALVAFVFDGNDSSSNTRSWVKFLRTNCDSSSHRYTSRLLLPKTLRFSCGLLLACARLPVLCISRCLVGHRRIWLLTFNGLSIVVAKIFVLPLTGHASYHGDRSFSVAGPRVWNSLPADLRLEMQFRAFRRQLKTVLFSR